MSELYQQVLGNDWLALAENIRRAHATGREMRGFFRITYGTGWLTKQLACWSRLPRATDATETCLIIFSDDSGERWERKFNAETFTTKQWKSESGRLVERFIETRIIE
jgi:hypothetical protein